MFTEHARGRGRGGRGRGGRGMRPRRHRVHIRPHRMVRPHRMRHRPAFGYRGYGTFNYPIYALGYSVPGYPGLYGYPYSYYGGYLPDEPVNRAAPKHWIGKKLIRLGQVPPTGADPRTVIMEEHIPQPYIVMLPGQLSQDYNPNRITIYLDEKNLINDVIMG